jgi:hypothetical protein
MALHLLRLAGAICLLLAPVAASPAAPAWHDPQNRREEVAVWQIEDIDASNDLRIVRLSRSTGGLKVEYHSVLTPGSPFYGDNIDVRRGDCQRSGYNSSGVGFADPAGAAMRQQLTQAVTACGATPQEMASALAGFTEAFDRLASWAKGRLAEKGQWTTPVPLPHGPEGTPLPLIVPSPPPH